MKFHKFKGQSPLKKKKKKKREKVFKQSDDAVSNSKRDLYLLH